MVKEYNPQKGDIVFLDFGSQKGHGQKGYRPAVIISNSTFNSKLKMALACPITSNMTKKPLHIPLNLTQKTNGVVMIEQLKSIDTKIRDLKYIEKIDLETLNEIEVLITKIIKS